MRVSACTIISKNYLAFARTVAKSFREHHPDFPFFVLLVDKVDGYFNPEQEPFELVQLEGLKITNLERLKFQYSIIELNTAVKPYLLRHLFEKYGFEKLIYFDPDILITRNLGPLFDILENHNVVLTPHLTKPYEDDCKPSEVQHLQTGVYNLGFIALKNSSVSDELLDWWGERLYDKCLVAPRDGIFVDQKWIDLAPGLYDGVYILRHPGYNIAYWNLHSRKVTFDSGLPLANDLPIFFFHFSGFDPRKSEIISKHQNRVAMSQIGEGKGLFQLYGRLLFENGYNETIDWPYAFGRFDNGAMIPDPARRIFHKLGEDSVKFGDPFNTSHQNNYFDWLNEPIDSETSHSRIITRLWYEMYQLRHDVQEAFPSPTTRNREAFCRWVLESGQFEFKLDSRFVSISPTRRLSQQNAGAARYGNDQTTVSAVKKSVKTFAKKIIGKHD